MIYFYSVLLEPVALFPLSPPTGESINPRVAGLIGRSGPQNKQPFMVAFFKATEVHLRSIRSAPGGTKQHNPKRSKGAKSQEALRVANVAGKHRSTTSLNLPGSKIHLCKINIFNSQHNSTLEPPGGINAECDKCYKSVLICTVVFFKYGFLCEELME